MRALVTEGLTERQSIFVNEILNGVNPTDAKTLAGYAETVPAWAILNSQYVQLAIQTEINRRLVTEAAPLAYSVLISLARDTTVPAAVRRNCARDLLDRAGYVPPHPDKPLADNNKSLSERSTGELQELIGRLESELGARAAPIGNAPIPDDDTPNPLEWMD